ncbi:MAG: DUF4838 domain-containing protein [Planctomycetota bacterium]
MTISRYFAAAVVLTGCSAMKSSQPADVALVRDGAPAAAIVISGDPTPAAKLAALELRTCIREIIGAELPVVNDGQPVEGVPILVGECEATRRMGLRGKDFGHVEYLVDVRSDAITLFGRDDPESTGRELDYAKATGGEAGAERVMLPGMYDARGSLRAAYHFLEHHCGVRFYGPRKANVHFPTSRTLAVPVGRTRRRPAIGYNRGYCADNGNGTWSWPLNNTMVGKATRDEARLYNIRVGGGGVPWYVNHTFKHLRYVERFHPDAKARKSDEWFEGARPEFFGQGGSHQLCYTSPELVKQLAADARDFFDGKLGRKAWGLEALEGRSRFFPVVPSDCGNFCRCERCQAILREHRDDRAAPFNNGEASHYVFGFVNAVAREVRKTHPDCYIGALAYENYFWYPEGLKMEPNVSVAPCLQVRNFWHAKTRENELAHYRKWIAASRRGGIGPVYLWNYYCHPEEACVMRKTQCFPHLFAREIDRLSKMYAADGVAGVFLCGRGEQLDFYLTMKLYDDPTLNVDELLAEFFARYFGAAAEPMRAFYLLIEERANAPTLYPQDGGHHQNDRIRWESLCTSDVLERLQAHMDEAKREASTELEKARVAAWDAGMMRYIRRGKETYDRQLAEFLSQPPHDRKAPGYIMGIRVRAGHRGEGISPYTLVNGVQMVEAEPGVLGTRGARLDIRGDSYRHWAGSTGADGRVWVEFDLGGVYSLDEIRIWNYSQNRGYGLVRRGMRQVKITCSTTYDLSNWRELVSLELVPGDDRAPFGPTDFIDCGGRNARLVRITAHGGPGRANHDATRRDRLAGLGAVRFYGKAVSKSPPPDRAPVRRSAGAFLIRSPHAARLCPTARGMAWPGRRSGPRVRRVAGD